jgi:hypothetical protein
MTLLKVIGAVKYFNSGSILVTKPVLQNIIILPKGRRSFYGNQRK